MVHASITPDYPFSHYEVVEESLPAREETLSELLVDFLRGRLSSMQLCRDAGFGDAAQSFDTFKQTIDVNRLGMPQPPDVAELFVGRLTHTLEPFVGSSAMSIADRIQRRLHGYILVQPLFDDQQIEEIVINGPKRPVIIQHRQAGSCITNLEFENDKHLRSFIQQTGSMSDKSIEDIRLPDGSRGNIVLPPACSVPAVTIRKFRKEGFSMTELVARGMLTSELAAHLWVAVEGLGLYPSNILVAGGTASGKTTFLNALGSFVPPDERIVTIEEVHELAFTNKMDWVPLETAGKLTLDDLVRNALRMKPDRIIVGEIRGKEAETMFTALNVGHRGGMGTLHANSDREAMTRLENEPMSVPRDLIPLLDYIIITHRLHDRRTGTLVRRVSQVSEISRIEDKIALNEIFARDPSTDVLARTDYPSGMREKLSKATGYTIAQVDEEIRTRKQIIDHLIQKQVFKTTDIDAFMSAYYAKRNETRAKPRESEDSA